MGNYINAKQKGYRNLNTTKMKTDIVAFRNNITVTENKCFNEECKYNGTDEPNNCFRYSNAGICSNYKKAA